jgi:DNA ligase (NAD+)
MASTLKKNTKTKTKTQLATEMKTKTEIEVQTQLKENAQAYYDDTISSSKLTDEEYDLLVEKNGIEFDHTQTNLRGDSVVLPRYMGSLDKIKTQSELDTFLKRTHSSEFYTIQPKIDGVSILVTNEHAWTRGNGTKGSNVDYLLPFILPKNTFIQKDHFVRGELVIMHKDFEKMKDKYENPRNMLVGILHTNVKDKKLMKMIKFIPYEVSTDKQIVSMDNFGIVTKGLTFVADTKPKTFNIDDLSNVLRSWKSTLPYPIDGLVIHSSTKNNIDIAIGKNTKASIAYKENVLKVLTTVVGIEWNLSRHSIFKPKIKLDPIVLNGAKIKNVTGHNYDYIQKHKINVGTVVEISRSGDVIPYIESIVKCDEKEGAQIPAELCKFGTLEKKGVDMMLISNGNDPEQNVQIEIHFYSTIGAKHLGKQTVRKLLEVKEYDRYDFMEECMSGKYSELYNHIPNIANIRKSIASIHPTLAEWIFGSGALPVGVGKKTIEPLLEHVTKESVNNTFHYDFYEAVQSKQSVAYQKLSNAGVINEIMDHVVAYFELYSFAVYED